MSASATPRSEFAPRVPWVGPDLQTIRNVLRGPVLRIGDGVRAARLELPLEDGSGDVLVARHLEPPDSVESPSERPLVVLVHGLGGSEESSYMETSAANLLARGLPVVQLNLRGAGLSRPLCKEQYHAGRSEDFAAALRALPPELSQDGIVAAGFSLGGNMLLKFAAEHGGLRGVVSVSAPIDLAAASRRFLDPRNRFYHRYLLGGMKREALGEGALVSDEERRIIPTLGSILEFDERIVAPRNGYRGAQHYYEVNHARQFLPEIRIPALVIHAQDDPWIPGSTYTAFEWSSNDALTFLFPRSGGHVGFHARGDRIPWHDRAIAEFIARLA